MLGIIGAMDVEVDSIKEKITQKIVTKIAGIDFVSGFIGQTAVCVAQCSPGKVNASLCTQAMIDNFDIDKIINVGVGCSLSKDVVIKNVVIANDVCEYDIDITALGEPLGFINGLNTIKIKTDDEFSARLAKTVESSSVHDLAKASTMLLNMIANTKESNTLKCVYDYYILCVYRGALTMAKAGILPREMFKIDFTIGRELASAAIAIEDARFAFIEDKSRTGTDLNEKTAIHAIIEKAEEHIMNSIV